MKLFGKIITDEKKNRRNVPSLEVVGVVLDQYKLAGNQYHSHKKRKDSLETRVAFS